MLLAQPTVVKGQFVCLQKIPRIVWLPQPSVQLQILFSNVGLRWVGTWPLSKHNRKLQAGPEGCFLLGKIVFVSVLHSLPDSVSPENTKHVSFYFFVDLLKPLCPPAI